MSHPGEQRRQGHDAEHQQHPAAIENDKYDPTLALAMRLARHLGTTVEELFTLEAGDSIPPRWSFVKGPPYLRP